MNVREMAHVCQTAVIPKQLNYLRKRRPFYLGVVISLCKIKSQR